MLTSYADVIYSMLDHYELWVTTNEFRCKCWIKVNGRLRTDEKLQTSADRKRERIEFKALTLNISHLERICQRLDSTCWCGFIALISGINGLTVRASTCLTSPFILYFLVRPSCVQQWFVGCFCSVMWEEKKKRKNQSLRWVLIWFRGDLNSDTHTPSICDAAS